MLILCIFLCIACYYDYRYCRIPNGLVLSILTWGNVLAARTGGVLTVISYLAVGAILVGVLYPLFRIGTIGGGDVKLLGACCGFFPKDKILFFLFFSLLFAALISLVRFMKKADLVERFTYLFSYLKEVADCGEWKLYAGDLQEKKQAGVRLAGPILFSILLFVGGLY